MFLSDPTPKDMVTYDPHMRILDSFYFQPTSDRKTDCGSLGRGV